MATFKRRFKQSLAALAGAVACGFPQAVWAGDVDEESPNHRQSECVEAISGAFVDQGTPAEVFVGRCYMDYHLRFEDGPPMSLEYADYLGDSYTCLDVETGLDHLVLRVVCTGSGCVPNYHVYRVNAENVENMENVESVESVESAKTNEIQFVFSMKFMDHDGLHRPLVTQNGECLWRGVAKAKAAFESALAPLVVGRKQRASPWDLEPGGTVALSVRNVPAETVVNALGAIRLYSDRVMLPLYVDVMEAEVLSEDVGSGFAEGVDRAAFQVLQMKRHWYCGGTGVLLVEDVRRRTWTAIWDFGAGDCARGSVGYTEGMEHLYVRSEKLYGRYEREDGLTDGGSWFEIDLRTHVARKLAEVPRFIAEALADIH